MYIQKEGSSTFTNIPIPSETSDSTGILMNYTLINGGGYNYRLVFVNRDSSSGYTEEIIIDNLPVQDTIFGKRASSIENIIDLSSLAKLGFENSKIDNSLKIENCELKINELPKLITGHIDILQIRNGQIHILDYKPNAEKERPIEQLTLYAMALSRLTGLRLFEFKCAWFDEKDYFEFYPLHVLHKPKKNLRRRKVYTMEGIYQINRNINKLDRIRPNT